MKTFFTFAVALKTALLAGTLDITAAFLNTHLSSGRSPVVVLQFVASGVLGVSSFEGGLLSALLGLIFHYFITFSWTVIFFFFYPMLNISPRFKVLSGVSYGIIIWLVMNLVILPFSNTPDYSPEFFQIILSICFIMFLIGLPISLLYHKYLKLN